MQIMFSFLISRESMLPNQEDQQLMYLIGSKLIKKIERASEFNLCINSLQIIIMIYLFLLKIQKIIMIN